MIATVGPGAESQVVGVGQDHLRAGAGEQLGRDPFDRSLRADWHEGRHFHRSVRSAKRAATGQRTGIGGDKVKRE